MDKAYLDFSKAFDVVSHPLLLDKLQLLGFDSIAISWIKSFLIGRTMSLSVSGTSSLSMPVRLNRCSVRFNRCSSTDVVYPAVLTGPTQALWLLICLKICDFIQSSIFL